MHKGKYVFAQLLDFIDKDVFLRLANKYDGNRYVKQVVNWLRRREFAWAPQGIFPHQ